MSKRFALLLSVCSILKISLACFATRQSTTVALTTTAAPCNQCPDSQPPFQASPALTVTSTGIGAAGCLTKLVTCTAQTAGAIPHVVVSSVTVDGHFSQLNGGYLIQCENLATLDPALYPPPDCQVQLVCNSNGLYDALSVTGTAFKSVSSVGCLDQ